MINIRILPTYQKIIGVLFFIFILIAAIVPSMVPAALANNIWSVRAIQTLFNQEGQRIPSPPPYHPHAEIWLDRQALQQIDPQSSAIELPAPTDDELSPAEEKLGGLGNIGNMQSLDVKARYLYQQGQYLEAFEIWKVIGQRAALSEAASEASALGINSLAMLAYQAAYEIDPEGYASSLARALQNNGDYDRAIDVVQQVLQIYPLSRSRPSWHIQMADIHRAQKAWEAAEALYQQVLAADPTAEGALIGMGWLAYQRDQNIQGAVDQFEMAMAYHPTSGAGPAAMGGLFSHTGEVEISAEWYRVAYERQQNLSYGLSYANALWQNGQTGQAWAEYQNLILRYPGAPAAHYHLARTYQQAGRSGEAVSAIETALSLGEAPNLTHIFLARSIYQENQLESKEKALYDEAHTAFLEIVEAYSEFPEPYLYIAQLYEVFGRPDQAIAAFQQALVLDPDNPTAIEGLNRLIGEG